MAFHVLQGYPQNDSPKSYTMQCHRSPPYQLNATWPSVVQTVRGPEHWPSRTTSAQGQSFHGVYVQGQDCRRWPETSLSSKQNLCRWLQHAPNGQSELPRKIRPYLQSANRKLKLPERQQGYRESSAYHGGQLLCWPYPSHDKPSQEQWKKQQDEP